jgi:hypothetical protein
MDILTVFLQAETQPVTDPIATIDLTTWGGIAGIVTLVMSIVKNFEWAKGRERLIAMGLGLVLAVASKLLHVGFQDVDWIKLVIAGVSAGPVAGMIYEHGTKAFKPTSDTSGAIPPVNRPKGS